MPFESFFGHVASLSDEASAVPREARGGRGGGPREARGVADSRPRRALRRPPARPRAQFAAYRYEAVKGQPLDRYFYVDDKPSHELGPFLANIYSVGDEVLSFEVLAKEGCKWTTMFVEGARPRRRPARPMRGVLTASAARGRGACMRAGAVC